MESMKIKDDFITLGQLLKLANLVSSGTEAKMCILDGLVLVNDKVELRRGRKLYHGDIIEFHEHKLIIE